MFHGIEHIAIASLNPHQLAGWYVRNLDCREVLDTGRTVYIRSANGVVLEFVYAESQPPLPQLRDAGIRHIAFSVDDLDVASETLISQGIVFADAETRMPGLRLRFFRDPEGNLLHLIQREVSFP